MSTYDQVQNNQEVGDAPAAVTEGGETLPSTVAESGGSLRDPVTEGGDGPAALAEGGDAPAALAEGGDAPAPLAEGGVASARVTEDGDASPTAVASADPYDSEATSSDDDLPPQRSTLRSQRRITNPVVEADKVERPSWLPDGWGFEAIKRTSGKSAGLIYKMKDGAVPGVSEFHLGLHL